MYIKNLKINLEGNKVFYNLILSDLKSEEIISLNNLPYALSITYLGKLICLNCNKLIKKSYRGYCYICFKTLPATDICILRPSLCHFDTCRDKAWGLKNCMIDHILYPVQGL